MIETMTPAEINAGPGPVPSRSFTREQALSLLQKRIDGVRVDDRLRSANGDYPGDIVLMVIPESVRRGEGEWKATVRLSRPPRRWSYVDEELAVIGGAIRWEEGLDVFFTTEDAFGF